jgi:hypothetical protein
MNRDVQFAAPVLKGFQFAALRRKEAQLKVRTETAIARDQGCANFLKRGSCCLLRASLNCGAQWFESPGFWFGSCNAKGPDGAGLFLHPLT